MIYSRKNFRKQYETAVWFVRKLHYSSGIVASVNEYGEYYEGFRRTANREGANYPEIPSESHIWLHAFNAWQNNPAHKIMSENFPQMTVAEELVMFLTSKTAGIVSADMFWSYIYAIACKLQNCAEKRSILRMLDDKVRSSSAVRGYAQRIIKYERIGAK